MSENIILDKLENIERMLTEQNLLQKSVINFAEACQYLDVSASHLYKMTSKKEIPHSCPNGKKLYFNRQMLDEWLQRNSQSSQVDLEKEAIDYVIKNKRS